MKWDKRINHLFPSNFFSPNNTNLVMMVKKYREHFSTLKFNAFTLDNIEKDFPSIKTHYDSVLSEIANKALKNLD